ncbi:3beta-hydroxysteroid-dehydrogenase/decarboxylase isoform 3 [Sesamum angolense]|uniref:3beta-hydroxysteroid-dehydrogenase/decarboxylase isoform 3 n=1 Tax=Sesamum angolense TaxID=2727404 RepID=A0AAE1X6U2_9LAMI|nr:3beta-hydroxysteroid-dehydrogenase/decarboxylase isoform 3 [Sesamum angolense]
MLLRLGNWIVRVADTAKTPELKPSESVLADGFASGRAAYFQVDVRHTSQIIQDFYFCYNVIVQGAKNVINACRECNVKHLIYNSSADVVFDDAHDIHNGDESLPYSGRVWDMVTDLKTQAEALILFANDIGGVLTCALRPCNVFGPEDKQLLPLLVNMAKSNWVKFIIGSGKNLSDFTYVDNVAHAHICAEESLSSQMGSVSGKVFFITNLEPMEFWEFASLLLEGLGYQRPVTSLPAWATHFIVLIIKLLHMKSDTRKLDPFVSVYNVATLALRTRTFSCSAAQKHIRYIPIVSMEVPLSFQFVEMSLTSLLVDELTVAVLGFDGYPPVSQNRAFPAVEAVESTVDSYSHLAVDSPFMICKDSNEPSKVEKLLGSGKVLCDSAATSMLDMNPVPRLPSSCFEISEVDMRNSFFTMRCMWNKLDSLAKSLAQGEDWGTFLKGLNWRNPWTHASFVLILTDKTPIHILVRILKICFLFKHGAYLLMQQIVGSVSQSDIILKASIFLYFFKLIVPPHFTVAVGLGLILSFSLCFVYEQYEERIDVIASVVLTVAERVLMLFVRKLPMSSGSVSFNCSAAVPDAGLILLTMDNKGYCNEGGNVQWYSSVEFFLIPPSIFL